MKPLSYILNAFKYYRKQQLAIIAGTLVSATVITGALLVGDSVSFSLKRLLDLRLGKIDFALTTADRFVTDSLVFSLDQSTDINAAGVLNLQGMLVEPSSSRWIPEVQIQGVDSAFWSIAGTEINSFSESEMLISKNVAEKLSVKIGDELVLRTENIDAVPVNTPFSEKDESFQSFRLKVTQILDNQQFGRYSLSSDQKAPYNVFISKAILQKELELTGKVNTVLFDVEDKNIGQNEIQEAMERSWKLADAALVLKQLDEGQVYELTSDRIFIDRIVEEKIATHFDINPIITYLVNGIRSDNGFTPYSFVSGVPTFISSIELAETGIILNDWCAMDLGVLKGDSVEISFFTLGSMQKLEQDSSVFVVEDFFPTEGKVFQRNLMPDFPGLADANSCSEWNTDLPIDLDKIRDKDEKYWDDHKGTPKGIISIEKAKALWSNRYGSATAIRFSSVNSKATVEHELSSIIKPNHLGFTIVPARTTGLKAATNGVDFGELFLSLGFFVILSAIILLVLLYSLNLLSRESEMHTLQSLGIPDRTIMRLFLGESLISISIGSIAGTLLGILFNKVALIGLNTIWQDAVRMSDLVLHITWQSLIIGLASTILVSVVTVYLVLRSRLKRVNIASKYQINSSHKMMHWALYILTFASIVASVLLLMYAWWQNRFSNATLFMVAGAFLIIGFILLFHLFLTNRGKKKANAIPSFWMMSIRNLARNRVRSSLTVALMAFGTFAVIITGSNRQTFAGSEESRSSGTGGFSYWMETSIPVSRDPNSAKGREVFQLTGEPMADSIEFLPLLTLKGDDASCLNLNQVDKPGILGVDPIVFQQKNAFAFLGTLEEISSENTWLGLNQDYGDQVIPAYIDQTVLTWGLMKTLGDTLKYTDDFGRQLNLVLAGSLNNTIFQGYVLISEKNMHKYFPSVSGANVMLIDGKPKDDDALVELVDFSFRDYGLEINSTSEKMKAFYSVTNTYLNVFLMLGALGLLIGTIGFGIMLHRNILERKREIALLEALGFSRKRISFLLFSEHALLLIGGLVFGLVGAFIGMLPTILTPSYSMPVPYILLIIFIILISGIGWIFTSIIFTRFPRPARTLREE